MKLKKYFLMIFYYRPSGKESWCFFHFTPLYHSGVAEGCVRCIYTLVENQVSFFTEVYFNRAHVIQCILLLIDKLENKYWQ